MHRPSESYPGLPVQQNKSAEATEDWLSTQNSVMMLASDGSIPCSELYTQSFGQTLAVSVQPERVPGGPAQERNDYSALNNIYISSPAKVTSILLWQITDSVMTNIQRYPAMDRVYI